MNRLLLLLGTLSSSASGGQYVYFGELEKGAVLHSGGWGARAQPPAAILPVLGKLRKLHPMSPALCLRRQEVLRTPCPGKTTPCEGAGEGGGSLGGEFRSCSQGLGQSGHGNVAFSDSGIKRETETAPR